MSSFKAFDIAGSGMAAQSVRLNTTASNLANADSVSTTQAGHIGGAASADATNSPDLKYRTPLAPALDGNTVDTQLEQAAFAENAVRYQATLTFLNSKFRNLMTAILGS